jgi:hypothetical protein
MKTKRNLFMVVIGFLSLLPISCSSEWHLRHYSGDGEVKIMPGGGIVEGGGGCSIKFKPIKLDSPTHFIYHFKGLPNWRFNLFFTIEDSREWTDKRQYEFYQQPSQATWVETNHFKFATYGDLKGTLTMSLKDAKGNVVIQFERKLSELIWSRAGLGPWDLYDENFVNFTPKSDAEYVLEVSLDPDPTLKDDVGYVLIRGGGREGISTGF